MPLATPSRRPKLPPVPAVLKAREEATSALATGSAALPAVAPEAAPEAAPKPATLHAGVPASIAVNMSASAAAETRPISPEHHWGERRTAEPPPGCELEIQLRKSNRHTVRSVRRNVSETPVPPRAAAASAKPDPTATDWDQLKSTLHSVIDDWVDRQKADADPAR